MILCCWIHGAPMVINTMRLNWTVDILHSTFSNAFVAFWIVSSLKFVPEVLTDDLSAMVHWRGTGDMPFQILPHKTIESVDSIKPYRELITPKGRISFWPHIHDILQEDNGVNREKPRYTQRQFEKGSTENSLNFCKDDRHTYDTYTSSMHFCCRRCFSETTQWQLPFPVRSGSHPGHYKYREIRTDRVLLLSLKPRRHAKLQSRGEI